MGSFTRGRRCEGMKEKINRVQYRGLSRSSFYGTVGWDKKVWMEYSIDFRCFSHCRRGIVVISAFTVSTCISIQ